MARAAQALVRAEAGSTEAWRLLDRHALAALGSAAGALAASVPYALARLGGQLGHHRRAAVRRQAAAMLALAGRVYPTLAAAALARMRRDRSRRVRTAVEEAMVVIGMSEGPSAD